MYLNLPTDRINKERTGPENIKCPVKLLPPRLKMTKNTICKTCQTIELAHTQRIPYKNVLDSMATWGGIRKSDDVRDFTATAILRFDRSGCPELRYRFTFTVWEPVENKAQYIEDHAFRVSFRNRFEEIYATPREMINFVSHYEKLIDPNFKGAYNEWKAIKEFNEISPTPAYSAGDALAKAVQMLKGNGSAS